MGLWNFMLVCIAPAISAALQQYKFGHLVARDGYKAYLQEQKPDILYFKYGNFSAQVNEVAFVPNTDEEVVFAAAVNHGLMKTTNFNEWPPTWAHVSLGSPATSSTCSVSVDQNQPSVIVIGSGFCSTLKGKSGSLFGLMRSTDGGTTWSVVPVPSPQQTSFFGTASVYGKFTIATASMAPYNFVPIEVGTFGYSETIFQMNSGAYVSTSGGVAVAVPEVQGKNCYKLEIAGDGDATYVFAACARGLLRLRFEDNNDSYDAKYFGNPGTLFGVRALVVYQPKFNTLIWFSVAGDKSRGSFYYTETPFASNITIHSSKGFASVSNDGAEMPIMTGDESHGAMAADPDRQFYVFQANDASSEYNRPAGLNPNCYILYGNMVNGAFTAKFAGTNVVTEDDKAAGFNAATHPDAKHLVFTPNGALVLAGDGGIYLSPNPKASPNNPTAPMNTKEPLTTGTRWKSKSQGGPNIEIAVGDYSPHSGVAAAGVQDNGCIAWSAGETCDLHDPAQTCVQAWGDLKSDGSTAAAMRDMSLIGAFYNNGLKTVDPQFNLIQLFPGPMQDNSFRWTRPSVNAEGTMAVLFTMNSLWRFQPNTEASKENQLKTDKFRFLNNVYQSRAQFGNLVDADAVWAITDGSIVRFNLGAADIQSQVLYNRLPSGMTSTLCVHPTNSQLFFVGAGVDYYIVDTAANTGKPVNVPKRRGSERLPVSTSCAWAGKNGETDTFLIIGTNQGVFVANYEPSLTWTQLLYGASTFTDQYITDVHYKTSHDVLAVFPLGDGPRKLENAFEALGAVGSFSPLPDQIFSYSYSSNTVKVTVEFTKTVTLGGEAHFTMHDLTSNGPDLPIPLTSVAADANKLEFDISALKLDPSNTKSFLISAAVGSIVDSSSGAYVKASRMEKVLGNSHDPSWSHLAIVTMVAQPARRLSQSTAASQPTNLLLEAVGPNTLKAKWTAGDAKDCVFQRWSVELQSTPASMTLHSSVFSRDVVEVTMLAKYPFKYQMSVREVCVQNETNSQPASLAMEVVPNSPPSQGAQAFSVKWDLDKDNYMVTDTTTTFQWSKNAAAPAYNNCTHKYWEVRMGGEGIEQFTPNGCGEADLSDLHTTSCTATNLQPDTKYQSTFLRQVCTDPNLTSKLLQLTELNIFGSKDNEDFLYTESSPCQGLCGQDSKCTNNQCVSNCAAGPCCAVGSANCGGDGLTGVPACVCAFDLFCCDTEWDGQCLDEAKKRCNLIC